MTSSRYLIARVAQAFGYFRRNLRMADAASEMRLLREAEAQLGAAIWEKVEGIEELSAEYWNLRKLIKEKEIVRQKLADCQVRLDQAHEERVNVLISAQQINQDLLDQRVELLMELEKLAHRRDEIVIEAREVRRIYDGMKMKLEVLTNESKGSEAGKEKIAEVKRRLAELKLKFSDLKKQRLLIGTETEAGDAKVDLVDEQLNEKKKDRLMHAFQVISAGNKEISILRAESGLLDTQMRQLYAEIGRFVSRNTHLVPTCAAAASSHQGLVDVMRALRRSVALNHRLAGNS
jgi:hypothetical protein